MPRNSPANRVFQLLTKIRDQKGNIAAITGWVAVFGLPETDGFTIEDNAARMLMLARRQVALARGAIQVQEADAKELTTAFDRAANIFATRTIVGNWQSAVRQAVDDDTFATWRTLAATQPETEPWISAKELEEAKTAIEQIREDIKKADLNGLVAACLLKHVGFMEQALREYPVSGATAFEDAYSDATAHWERNLDLLQPAHESQPVKKIRRWWRWAVPAAALAFGAMTSGTHSVRTFTEDVAWFGSVADGYVELPQEVKLPLERLIQAVHEADKAEAPSGTLQIRPGPSGPEPPPTGG